MRGTAPDLDATDPQSAGLDDPLHGPTHVGFAAPVVPTLHARPHHLVAEPYGPGIHRDRQDPHPGQWPGVVQLRIL